MKRLPIPILLVAATLSLRPGSIRGEEPQLQPLAKAAVKNLSRSAAPPPQPAAGEMATRTLPATLLPADRFPQYRVGYQRTDAVLQSLVTDGKFRFVLTHPTIIDQVGRPLLVEARIKIDGQPFSDVRDTKARLLAEKSAMPKTDDSDNPSSVDPDEPATLPAYTPTADPEELLRRYATTIGETPDPKEAAWLMTHWTDGPSLLVTHPYFQSFRSHLRPVFDVLDRDRNGTISTQELDDGVESFNRCDANRDGVVDALEIAKAAASARDPAEPLSLTGPLFWLLPEMVGVQESDPLLFGGLRFFDTNNDGQLQASEIDTLAEQTADIELEIDFHRDSVEASQLWITRVTDACPAKVGPSESFDGLDVIIGPLTINFCGVQEFAANENDGQVSFGAIVDGYPLLPLLDPNDDGRFTIRELRTLHTRLDHWDLDRNGSLTNDEVVSPIRVCIGNGAVVHRELANIRSIQRENLPKTITGPDWFARMDRNQDNDLTREEFPGTDEQFKALDSDGDRLISGNEAREFDTRSAN